MTIEAQATAAASRPDRSTLLIYLSALTAMFMAVLDMNIVVTAMPTLAHDLGEVSLLGWVDAAYLLSSAAVSPFYGKLGDMYGRKSIVVFAVAAFLAGSLLCGLAWSMPALIAARVVQGIGGGGLMVSAFAIIGELFEPRERAKYQGYSSIVFTVGTVVGPVGGGYLTGLFGWRSVFLVNMPIGVLVLAAILLFMQRKPATAHHKVDISAAYCSPSAPSPSSTGATMCSRRRCWTPGTSLCRWSALRRSSPSSWSSGGRPSRSCRSGCSPTGRSASW